jgi:hypothetical protein
MVECAGIRQSLTKLIVLDAPSLTTMPGFTSFPSLSTMRLWNAEMVDYFSWPPMLENGQFSRFGNSPDWVGFHNLTALRNITFSASECKDFQVANVSRLSSLVLEDLSKLEHLTMNGPASLTTFDINRIGGLVTTNISQALYIDISDVMAVGANFTINAVGNFSTSCLGIRLAESSAAGAVENVVLRGLRHPTGVTLEGLRALRSVKIADCDVAWFDVEQIGGSMSGFAIEISNTRFINETIYLSNKELDSRHGVDKDVLANLRRLSVTASQFTKFEVIGMYGLTSIVASGGQDTFKVYLQDLQLTELDLAMLDGNSSGLAMELENVSIVAIDGQPPPPFLLDGYASGVSASLRQFRFTGGASTQLSKISLEYVSQLKDLEIGEIASLTSLQVSEAPADRDAQAHL